MVHAQLERQGLVEDLLRVGPDAPTLCEGWRAADLAAHLVVRDRRPDAAAGILIRPLARYMARVQQSERDRWSWHELVERVRSGPPFPIRLPPVDAAVNTVEYFVHHEDVLRAQPAALPRRLDPGFETLLWNRTIIEGRVLLRRAPVSITLTAPGYGRITVRGKASSVTVTGAPGELMLWMFGRQQAADVTYTGDELSIERLKASRLGL